MKTTNRKIHRLLLINPWIYDFAAYDFWFKPVGLLSIAAVLQQRGYQVDLIDCLDRHHPELLRFLGTAGGKSKNDGTGKFFREEIEKPVALRPVPRKYCRYGYPLSLFTSLLARYPDPDAVLITSFMTYWYPAVEEAVRIVRQVYPQAIVVLGGIYATLCPQHAQERVQPDYLIIGEGEEEVLRLFAAIEGNGAVRTSGGSLDDYPFPAFDLYPRLESVALLTSRGCPFRCHFCASKSLVPKHRRRSPENVLREIAHWHEKRGVRHFAFFDDALLHHADQYIKPLLRGIIEREYSLQLHTPNGLQPRNIDQELADLLFHAGAKTLRLSFETSNPLRQKSMSAKVNNADLRRAVQHLERAGFERQEIGVYVLFGLADQDEREVKESVKFVNDLGAKVNLASFSPIPQTDEWQRAISFGLWHEEEDLLLTNNSLFPLWSKTLGHERCQELVTWVKEVNESVVREKC